MALRTADDDPVNNPGDNYAKGLFKREKQGSMNGQPITDDVSKLNDAEEKGTTVGTEEPGYKNSVTGRPDDSSAPGGFRSWLWKNKITKGPMLFIATVLLGGGLAITTFLSPGLILVHMKESLVGWLDNASPALSIRTNKMLYSKFKETKNAFSESAGGKCNIKCRFGSINETMKLNLKARGFTIDATERKGLFGTRYSINSMTFPGEEGFVVKNGADFAKAMEDPVRAASFKKVFNSKTAYYLNSRFGLMLREKFGLNKLSKLTADIKEGVDEKVTSAKERVKASIREALGLPKIDTNAPKLSVEEKINANPKMKVAAESIKTKVDIAKAPTKAAGIISGFCAAYNVGRGVTFAVKAAKMSAFIGFAMMFLNAADQIKAGDADPDVISALGDQLTQVDANGKSATDAIGYRMAAFGDNGTFTNQDKEYSARISGDTLGFVSKFLAFGGSSVSTITKFGTACKVGGFIGFDILAACPAEIAFAVATGFETVGVGAAAGLATCAAKIIAIQAVISIALGKLIGSVIPSIAKNDMPALDENTIGTPVGNSIYTGTAQLLGGAAASYGLKAGDKKEIEQYAIDTATIRQQENAIASYEAKDTPFDIYNPNSFLGSIVQTLNISALYNSSSLSSVLTNVLSIIPKSLATITNNVGADANNKAALYDGKCDDPALNSLGVSADAFCNPSYVMSSGEMSADIYQVVDEMIISNNIDENGEAIPESDYQNYLTNCVNRVEPLGETGSAIEDDGYEWKIGLRCVEDSELLSNFRTYTMDKAINETMDGTESSTTTTTTEPAASYLTEQDIAEIIQDITLELGNQSQSNGQSAIETSKKQTLSTTIACNTYTNCKISGDDTPLADYETKKDIFSKLGYIYNRKPVYIS